MTYEVPILHGEPYTDEELSKNASAVASTLIPKTDVRQYNDFSLNLANREAGGGETLTVRVWSANRESPAALAHAGAAGWSQIGGDLTLAPGGTDKVQWGTAGYYVGVTMVATGAITGNIDGTLLAKTV